MKELIEKANEIVKFHVTVSKELKKLYRTNLLNRFRERDTFQNEKDIFRSSVSMDSFFNCSEKTSCTDVGSTCIYSTVDTGLRRGGQCTLFKVQERYLTLDKVQDVTKCTLHKTDTSVMIDDEIYSITKNVSTDMLFQMSLMIHENELLSYIVLCELKKLDPKIIPDLYRFDIIHDDNTRDLLYKKTLDMIESNQLNILKF